MFEISAVTEPVRYDWPDTDDELSICPLLSATAVDAVRSDAEELSALYDSGSDLSTCPADS